MQATGTENVQDKHPLQQRPVERFSSLLIHSSRSSPRRRVNCPEVPSQLTGAPQSNDWWEVTGARADAALGETAPPPRCGGAPRFAVLFEGCPIPLKVAWTACGGVFVWVRVPRSSQRLSPPLPDCSPTTALHTRAITLSLASSQPNRLLAG